MRLFAAATIAAALLASPAAAQDASPAVPKALTDPAMADRLARVMQAMSKSFLELPVGDMQAAIEGREPSASERGKTIGAIERARDPDFDRKFQQQVAGSKPMLESAMKALAASLPAMMEGMEKARGELEKGAANLPRPNYPKQ